MMNLIMAQVVELVDDAQDVIVSRRTGVRERPRVACCVEEVSSTV